MTPAGADVIGDMALKLARRQAERPDKLGQGVAGMIADKKDAGVEAPLDLLDRDILRRILSRAEPAMVFILVCGLTGVVRPVREAQAARGPENDKIDGRSLPAARSKSVARPRVLFGCGPCSRSAADRNRGA